MKKELFYFLVLSLTGVLFLFPSCESEDGGNTVPSLAGTSWQYTSEEKQNEVEMKVLSFTEEEYTLAEIFMENDQIVDLYQTSGTYLFDGETLAFKVEYNGDYAYYEMKMSTDGTHFVWETANGNRIVFEQ